MFSSISIMWRINHEFYLAVSHKILHCLVTTHDRTRSLTLVSMVGQDSQSAKYSYHSVFSYGLKEHQYQTIT